MKTDGMIFHHSQLKDQNLLPLWFQWKTIDISIKSEDSMLMIVFTDSISGNQILNGLKFSLLKVLKK